jgi:uncharacterized protein YcbK (DUF882 family)
MGDLSTHFSSSEFACKCGLRGLKPADGYCGGKSWVSAELVQKLEELRAAIGNRPILITSGCRCQLYNRYVGGASASQHLMGTAADVTVKGMAPSEVAKAADKLDFGGVGRYKTFTHVDVRPGKARWRG